MEASFFPTPQPDFHQIAHPYLNTCSIDPYTRSDQGHLNIRSDTIPSDLNTRCAWEKFPFLRSCFVSISLRPEKFRARKLRGQKFRRPSGFGAGTGVRGMAKAPSQRHEGALRPVSEEAEGMTRLYTPSDITSSAAIFTICDLIGSS